ncbi:hypothetical protein QAD02_017878 [Eretmocerus hayati]|uniref:Uncharacterized protein n=1 Tax=Eretmocerus hayati TaxID=131215 RepID=A0ACC2PF44_9HYME|nr:hypothetical protein QAD02_017878 [Eretmocerus hayati]
MRSLTIFLVLATSVLGDKASFENYKVFRIIPDDEDQVQLLRELEDTDQGFTYWRGPTRASQPVDVMVAPDQLDDFAALMNFTGINRYETFVSNVQRLIERENPSTREGGFGWKRYHNLDEIYSWMESLAAQNPGKVKLLAPGRTYQGRQIKGVKLSLSKDGTEKPGIFVEGGIHAREWISPATVTYLINQLLTSEDSQVQELAQSYDWYMFPSFNPDGYVHTHTSNRMWRKTLSRSGLFCKGADANRNWGFKWMSGGASSNPCSDTYAGSRAFSEIETRTMSEYLKSIGDKLFAYIAFHSYSQLLLFPYGHTREHLDNHDESLAIGTEAIGALSKRYGTKYITGNIAETIYVASGSSMDWAKANIKVPVAFTYELRDKGNNGFILPADQIIPNGEEILDSFVALFRKAGEFGYPVTKKQTNKGI